MKEPSTTLEFIAWARENVPQLVRQRALTRGQGRMVKELASYVDARGCCFASPEKLGEGVGVGKRQAERLLHDLTRAGLLETTLRGRARVARRRLCPSSAPVVRPAQLSFDDLLEGTLPKPAASARPQPAEPPAARRPDPTFSASDPTSLDVGQKEHLEVAAAAGRAREARATTEHSSGIPALQPHLGDVLAVLEAVPELTVEPLAVNAALAAYPQDTGHDHLRAAHTVASWALEGGLRNMSANRQLMSALRKQSAPKPRRTAARRRAAPPVCESVARGDALLRAAFEKAKVDGVL